MKARIQSRHLSLALLAASFLLLLFTVLGGSAAAPTAEDVVRARAIELVDARGQVRAQLDIEDSGEVVFRLRDSQGTIRVKIGAGEDGSGLLLLDEKTEPGVQMVAKGEGTSFALSDGAAKKVFTP